MFVNLTVFWFVTIPLDFFFLRVCIILHFLILSVNNQSGLDDGGVDGDNGDADGQTEGKTANVPKVR